MSPANPRKSARTTLDNKSPVFAPVTDEQRDWLAEVFGCSGIIWKIGKAGKNQKQGHYYLETGSAKLFVKVFSKEFRQQQLAADSFARLVQSYGVRANSAIPDRIWDKDGLTIIAYEWIDGRFAGYDSDPKILGRAIGKLHAALRNYRHVIPIKSNTASRYAKLDKTLNSLLLQNTGVGPKPEQALALFKRLPDAFSTVADETCQVLHGDLNVGNILISGGDVVFLDFEDCIHSWLPRRFEVAYALERLVLVNEVSDKRAYTAAISFLDEYFKTDDNSLFLAQDDLFRALQWLSIRSLCMLHDYQVSGFSWPETEWKKFLALIEQMDNRRVLITKIESHYF